MINAEDASKLLRCSKITIYRYVHQGLLHPIKQNPLLFGHEELKSFQHPKTGRPKEVRLPRLSYREIKEQIYAELDSENIDIEKIKSLINILGR